MRASIILTENLTLVIECAVAAIAVMKDKGDLGLLARSLGLVGSIVQALFPEQSRISVKSHRHQSRIHSV